MKDTEKICLTCKKYRLQDTESGICRLHKVDDVALYPKKKNEDTCESWKNCGQQYYIRLGWIKKTKGEANNTKTGVVV